jgi:hypothetical protein
LSFGKTVREDFAKDAGFPGTALQNLFIPGRRAFQGGWSFLTDVFPFLHCPSSIFNGSLNESYS